MKNKKLEIAALIPPVLYGLLCLGQIVFCLVQPWASGGAEGVRLAYVASDMFGFLTIIPALPIGSVLNVFVIEKKRSVGMPYQRWLLWAILSPLCYIVLWAAACVVFVATTGA